MISLPTLSDKDASVGRKSKAGQFFGYQIENTVTAEERILTAMDVHSGEYVDVSGAQNSGNPGSGKAKIAAIF